ncbi:hypothetical protein [Streptomyces sp. NPDC059787]|uniref:hypothetical protein n=1 Tax=Streptomyces sp. NPDC059787 TaxID=3346947 RepID=UPI0036574834
MPAREMPLIVDPAGRDNDLRTALDDLRMNRWLSTHDLLFKTGTDWALRTSRSQVLAVGAGDGGAIAAWLKEEPGNPDALMMWTRVLTRQATRAMHRGVDGEVLRRAAGIARDACWKALRRCPDDPVLWICLLCLAGLPLDARYLDPFYRHRPHHWGRPSDPTLPPGPWPLLDEVERRDPGNREAYHRMREYFHARVSLSHAVDFSRWVAMSGRAGSPLLMLPLYAFVTEYQCWHGDGRGAAIRYWSTDRVVHHTRRARDDWFYRVSGTMRAQMSLLDLNHLAHALTACGEPGAEQVFEAIGPYATSAPWAQVSSSLGRDWQVEFCRLRDAAHRKAARYR